MKYAIEKCVNGAFSIDSEWSDLDKTKAAYHGRSQTLWASNDVKSAFIAIIDEQLDVVEGYKEYIHHEAAAE